ncbi:hypothetical protein IV203_030055 [Nitzschia inconspicua]|uniref:Uncharacterized protein n=1 Tax=Nitzschia inconspicua TaxID=303405 RepID=A0A9K3LRV9_9STRA|nr:hypothetical protein IV203_030055 [Nitzschia inconspicua]
MIFNKNLGLSSYVDYFESAKSVALNATSWTGLSFGESWQADENESISISNTAVSPNPELQLSTTDPLVWTGNLYQYIRDNKIILSASAPIKVDEEVGFIIPSGGSTHHRFVVNVIETYLFWNNGQDRLCQLLRRASCMVCQAAKKGRECGQVKRMPQCWEENEKMLQLHHHYTPVYHEQQPEQKTCTGCSTHEEELEATWLSEEDEQHRKIHHNSRSHRGRRMSKSTSCIITIYLYNMTSSSQSKKYYLM